MSGDFTRDSFDPSKNFTRVLMQQGRPQLDADWNEQIAIFWRYWRGFVEDLIGPYAGPADRCGFDIITQDDPELKAQDSLRSKLKAPTDFLVSPGRFYVNGILCENHEHFPYDSKVAASEQSWPPQKNALYLIYLDVWERNVSALEDAAIPEPALGGLDTCIRTKVMWRVRTWKLPEPLSRGVPPDFSEKKDLWQIIVRSWHPAPRGHLKARLLTADGGALSGSGFRGLQNQLYRIEIHDGGSLSNSQPTFKMSRENGSVEFRIVSPIKDKTVTLESMGRDARFGLKNGNWVEIVAPHAHANMPGPLRKVQRVDISARQVQLDQPPPPSFDDRQPLLLRRWDHVAGDSKSGLQLKEEGAVIIKEGSGEQSWLTLENGLQIQFQRSSPANSYITGDYWLIPARVATGGILWPQDGAYPAAVPPHGVEHYYAPLRIFKLKENGTIDRLTDCRPRFEPVAKPPPSAPRGTK